MNLKNQLKQYLVERGLSASELARKTGVSKQSLSDWLAGVHPRDLSKLKIVADELGVSVDHLLFGQGVQVQTLTFSGNDPTKGWTSGIFEVRFRRIRN